MKTVKISIVVFLAVVMIALTNVESGQARTVGDLNNDGQVTVEDLIIARRYLLEIQDLDQRQKESADVNKDGIINDADVQLIREICMGGQNEKIAE